MNNVKKLLSLFLSLVLLLALAAPAFAAETDGSIYRAVVRFGDDADADALCAELEALPGVSVRWRYSTLLRGAAIEGTRSALALAGASEGVDYFALSRTWGIADVITDPLSPGNSADVMNAIGTGYDGDGMVIAVIDSGMKVSHETFADYGILKEPALSREDIEAFAAEVGTEGRYVSAKIPFAYDYAHDDRSIHTSDYHGTHVAALAAGFALRADGSVKFSGVAPAAQILGMKVFPDNAGDGADDTDILKALEDAYLLGADVINLSLGVPNAFIGDGWIGAIYRDAVAVMEAAGVIVCCAVGNSGTALFGLSGEDALPGGAYTDYGTAAAPAIYDGTAAIAAVGAAFYEAGGGIIAGDRTILYTETISEHEDWTPPSIETLAGRTLRCVAVGGVGSAEDFAGLDLKGCVALVERGEIYFSEKANNAAAAGAVLCLIYNNEPGEILPAVDGTTIPCVLLSQEDGRYLLNRIRGGNNTIAIAPERMNVSSGDATEMVPFSSWGAAADLSLVPTLSAPGGTILSAGIGSNDEYIYFSGTSMAAPNAAGAYTLLLQALLERGVEDRAQRAQLANELLESTARPLTDENGVTISPRRQGAGLIDLNAALAAGAVITEPLLELGEDPLGSFTLRFTVENLSEEDKEFAVDVTVLTDACPGEGGAADGVPRPQDITDDVFVSGLRRVRVAAGERRDVTLTLKVSSFARQRLEETFPNGFFTEGYVTLTDRSREKIHATFLGYCGDWEAAPIIEQTDFRDVMNANYRQEMCDEDAVAALPVEMGINYVYLCNAKMETYGALVPGENPWLVTPALEERMAMSARVSDGFISGGDRFVINLYTLRNAEHVIMVVYDRNTGEIYQVNNKAYLPRSQVAAGIGAGAAARFVWDGTDRAGVPVETGTAAEVVFFAWLETETAMSEAYAAHAKEIAEGDFRWLLNGSYEDFVEWRFPLVVDGQAPKVRCSVNLLTRMANITVQDEHFVAYAAVQNAAGDYLAEQTYAEKRAGARHVISIPLESCGDGMIYVAVVDYAGNSVGYEIDTTVAEWLSNDAEVVRCPSAMLKDVRKDAWYHDAVDFVIENGLMKIDEGLSFSPEVGALRVQVLEMLYDLAGQPEADADTVTLPFTDVTAGAGYRSALEWAYSLGIVTGYNDKQFGAYAPIQRDQLAAMLMRAAVAAGESADCGEVTFADEAEIAPWAAQAMKWAAERGYLTADEEGNIAPRRYVTRAEFAALLMKFYENKHN